MTTDVRWTVLSCEVRQQAKHSAGAPTFNRQWLYAGWPWQRLAVDLVGHLPQTAMGNVWIHVLTDHFTRWSDAITIPDVTASMVAGVLEERIFSYFGLPEVIQTEQGAQFQELCQLWGVDRSRKTPYRSEGNGIVERNNWGLGDSLRTLLTVWGQEEWDLVLLHLMRTLRGILHSAAKENPNFMLLGQELRLPGQLQYRSSV